MSDKPKPPRYIWLIPLAMLIAAILACSPGYSPPPIVVERVEASADTMGKAYAQVGLGLPAYNPTTSIEFTPKVYETNDYGVTWQPSQHTFADTAQNSYDIRMYDGVLDLNKQRIWVFPRSTFRIIFLQGFTLFSSSVFDLPYGNVSNAAQGNTVYIAMGTEGVLVAKYDSENFTDWKLSANGIETLKPLPLTITDPVTILCVVVLILLVPPFALIHAYLLQRVWVYLLPAKQATYLGLIVAVRLVVLVIAGSILWLTNAQTDLYPIIGVLTLITVATDGLITAWLANRAKVSRKTGIWLIFAAIFLSLITPVGVASLFLWWWAIYAVVFVHWAYQRVYWQYIDYEGPTPLGRRQRWNVDRLALEMVLIVAVGGLSIIILLGVLQTFLPSPLIPLLGLGLVVAGLRYVFQHNSSHRAITILQIDTQGNPNHPISEMPNELWRNTIFCHLGIILATVATFIGQFLVSSWFTTLLK